MRRVLTSAQKVSRRDYLREWRRKNPDKVAEQESRQADTRNARRRAVLSRETPDQRLIRLAKNKAWRDANPDKMKAYGASRDAAYRGKRDNFAAAHRVRVRNGIVNPPNREQLDAAWTCDLCSDWLYPRNRVVDHDKNTGLVRGILHRKCNGALGIFGDNAEGLRKALAYLERFEQEKA